MPDPVVPLPLAWVEFLDERRVTAPAVLAALPTGFSADGRVRELVTTYLDEGPVAVDLLAPHLGRPMRILEIGSGIGLVSRFLAGLGHDVVATEPAAEGFELMRALTIAVDVVCGPLVGTGSLTRLDAPVDDLDPVELGAFDVVFSANVIEHVPDPVRALRHLQRFVTAGGIQTHVCPNYAFPYDPHIRRPLIPVFPASTRRLLPSRLAEAPEFTSVNFVTAAQVRRTARAEGLDIEFGRGTLAAALERFDVDPTFADRHAGLGPFVRALGALGISRLLARIPPRFASPMRFVIRARGPVGFD